MEAYSEGLPVVFSSYGALPGRAEIVPMLQMRKLKPENLKYGGRQWGTRTWTMFRLFVARGTNQAYLGICLPVCLPSMPSTVMAGLHCYPLPACDTKIHNSGMIYMSTGENCHTQYGAPPWQALRWPRVWKAMCDPHF